MIGLSWIETFHVYISVFGGLLESPQWLLLAFCPKIFGGGGNLWMLVLLEKEFNFSDGDNQR